MIVFRYAVITHRGEIPNKDVLEVYSKMIGITASHNVKDAAEINFSKGVYLSLVEFTSFHMVF